MWPKSKRLLAISLSMAACMFLLPSVAVASTIVQSTICPPLNTPAITAPAPGSRTTYSSVHIVGTASAGSTVTVFNDGHGAGAAVATSGNFGLDIPLGIGANSLVATTVNNCNTIKSSATVTVTRLAAAGQAPTTSTPAPSTPAAVPEAAPATVATTASANIATTPVAPTAAVKKAAPVATPATPTSSKTEAIITNPPASVDDIKASGITLDAGTSSTGAEQQVITSPKPNQVTSTRHTWVTGQTEPLTNVSVYLNKSLVAKVVSDSNGLYGALVSLQDGENSIHVLAKCSDGQVTLRLVNVKLASSQQPVAGPVKQSNKALVYGIIASFAIGGICISSSIWWHTWHLRKNRLGAGGPHA